MGNFPEKSGFRPNTMTCRGCPALPLCGNEKPVYGCKHQHQLSSLAGCFRPACVGMGQTAPLSDCHNWKFGRHFLTGVGLALTSAMWDPPRVFGQTKKHRNRTDLRSKNPRSFCEIRKVGGQEVGKLIGKQVKKDYSLCRTTLTPPQSES